MNTLFLENFGFRVSETCFHAEERMQYKNMYRFKINSNFRALTVSAERISSLSFIKFASETIFVTQFVQANTCELVTNQILKMKLVSSYINSNSLVMIAGFRFWYYKHGNMIQLRDHCFGLLKYNLNYPGNCYSYSGIGFSSSGNCFGNPGNSFINPGNSFSNSTESFRFSAESFSNSAESLSASAESFGNSAESFSNSAESINNSAEVVGHSERISGILKYKCSNTSGTFCRQVADIRYPVNSSESSVPERRSNTKNIIAGLKCSYLADRKKILNGKTNWAGFGRQPP